MTITSDVLNKLRSVNPGALTAKIMLLSGQAVLSDLRTVGSPLYSTPVKGNWLARIHKFAAKRNVSVMDLVYVREGAWQ